MSKLPSFPRLAAASASALAAVLAAATAGAQSVPAQPAPLRLDEVVTVGSRFGDRTAVNSPVPIDLLTNQELQRSGLTEVNQLLQRLVPSFNFPRPSVTDGTDHVRPATLRGLAPDQVLVLVNGKRRHPSALINVNGTVGRGSGMVDLNAIPVSMIARIEVLRDGATAQYGSDAIAGVINIILKDDATGEFATSFGQTAEGDGTAYSFSVATGVELPRRGNFAVTAYYRTREGTNRAQDDTRQQYFSILRNAAGTQTGLGAISGNFGSGNFGSGTGLSAPGGTAPAGGTVSLDPREATISRRNHWQGDSETKDRGVFMNLAQPLSDAVEVYAFGGVNVRDGQASGFFRRPGDDRTVRALWPNGFLPLIESEVIDASLGGGVKGRAGAWNYDASLVYGSNRFAFTVNNSNNVTLGGFSPTRFRAGVLDLSQFTLNADVTRSFDFGGTPLNLASGLEYRRENYMITPGEPDSWRDGGIRLLDGPATGALGAIGAQVFPGFRPTDGTDVSRNSWAVYFDGEIQPVQDLTVTGAVRFEDFSDSGSTTNFKLSGRYELPAGFAVRGAASTGFRAPSLGQQFFTSTATNFITVSGVLTPVDTRTLPVNTIEARLLGAEALEPEKSVNFTFGLTYSPSASLTVSLDFYQIEIEDRIVLSSTFADPAIAQFFEVNSPPGQPIRVGGARYFTNAVDTKTQGFDFNLHYAIDLAEAGRLTLTGGYNRNSTRVTGSRHGLRADRTVLAANPALQAFTGTPLFDLTERVRMEKGQPADTIAFSAQWEIARFSLTTKANRFGEVQVVQASGAGWDFNRIQYLTPGYEVQFAPAYPTVARGVGATPGARSPAQDSLGRPNAQVIQTFDARWIFDLDLSYRVTDSFTVAVGAQNLFDTYPQENIRSKVPVTGTVAAGANNGQGADNIGIFAYSANGGAPFGINGRYAYVRALFRF